MKRFHPILSDLPDCDDTLRRLADVLQMPHTCRRSRCQRRGACQGGYGPPCYLEDRRSFVLGVGEQMQEYREFWHGRYRAIQAEERRR
ncbi:hypothetical protein [Microvirga mediterraneensis]|uniref:Uncharacterized protein n=1 Tax=Microvirga mediterraneensis TaxID=2754695 RepID=A0A838BSB8_9HYPH|nr:hypothetical protein [Microvirga mediterraneensis]MBA1157929.1 hypothetical protein [Microvirga mediterraneensis]